MLNHSLARGLIRYGKELGLLALALASGCAHWGQTHKEEALTLSSTTTDQAPPVVDFKADSGLVSYSFKKASGETVSERVEWMTCIAKKSRGTVLIMHDQTAFESAIFCQDWLAQTFLSQGLAVTAVNRPGYGRSTGAMDLVGSGSIYAIQVGIAEVQGKASMPKILGAYGYGMGAAAAALVAKRMKGLEFLLLGGGVYDLEDTWQKTADEALKQDIESLRKRDGDQSIEQRSVGYDVAGLPKMVAIYHGKLDTTVPPSQAKSFSDSLETSGESRVTMQVIEGLAHDVPPQHHRKILEVLILSTATHI